MATSQNTVEIRILATGSEQAAQVMRSVADAGAKIGNVVGKSAQDAAKQLTGLGDTARRVGEIFAGMSLANVFEQGLVAMRNFAVEASRMAQEAERQQAAFTALTASIGVNGKALAAQLAAAADGLLDIEDAMQAASKALIEGLQPKQVVELMETSRQLAKLFGGDVVAAFTAFSEAVATGNTRTLRQIGINVDATEAIQKYAASLGVEVDQLSSAGRAQAVFTAAMEKARPVAEGLSKTTGLQAETLQRLRVAWKETQETIGQVLNDVGMAVLDWLKQIAGQVPAISTDLQKFGAIWKQTWEQAKAALTPVAQMLELTLVPVLKLVAATAATAGLGLAAAFTLVAGPAAYFGSILADISQGKLPDLKRAHLEQNVAAAEARVRLAEAVQTYQQFASGTATATTETEKLTETLTRTPVALTQTGTAAKATAAEIDKLAEAMRRLMAAFEREGMTEREREIAQLLEPFEKMIAGFTGKAPAEAIEALKAAYLNWAKSVANATIAQREFNKSQDDVVKAFSEAEHAQAKAEREYEDAKGLETEAKRATLLKAALEEVSKAVDDLSGEFKVLTGETAKTQQVWTDFFGELEKIDQVAKALGQSFGEVLSQKISTSEKAIRGLTAALDAARQAGDEVRAAQIGKELGDIQERLASLRQERFGDALATDLAAVRREASLLGSSVDGLARQLDVVRAALVKASDPANNLTENVAGLKEEFDRLSDIKEVRDAMTDILSSVGSAINTLVQGVILGTQKMSDAFKKLGQAIVTEFVNMVIQRALKPLVAAGADVVAALFGFVASAAAGSGSGGSIATGITSTGGGGTGLSAGADFGGTAGASSATNALGLLNKGASTIGAASGIFQSGALVFQHTVLGFQGASGITGLAGGFQGFLVGLDAVAKGASAMAPVFAGVTAAIAIAFTALRDDITDTGKAVLSAGYAIAGGLAIAAFATGQGYLLLVSAGVALVTAILDWTGVFEKASADWLKFSSKLTHTLGLEQDALIAFGTTLEKTTSLVGIAESIEAFRHRIEGAGVGGFFAATAGRGAFTVPGIPGATGTEHEGGLRFDFGPFIQQFQDAINEVLNVVRETISTKMPEIAKTMMPADIADAFISGTLVPLRAEFEALIASGTTTIEQIAAFEEKLNSMGDLMAGFGTAAGAIDILKKGAAKVLPEDISPGVIKSADELRAKLLDLAKSGTATKEQLEALIGQIQLLSQVAQMMGEAAFVLKELGAVANESLGDLGPTVGASVEKLRAELVALANSGTATAAQLVELQARIAALGSQVALYMRLHDEIAQLSGDIDQVTERMIVNMRGSFAAADRAIETAGEQLAKAIDSPDIAAAQVAMEQAILNRYKLERDLIAQIEETIQDILNQRGPSLITNAMRAVNDALERTDTRPLLHMITALEGVQRASISASAKLWAATAAIQALAAAVPSIVRGFQSQITDPTQFAQALLDAAMPSLETIAGLYGKAIAAGDINSALLALEAGSGAILGLADAAIAGVRQWEAAAVAAAEAAAAAQIDAVNAAAQAQIDAVNATAQADIDRINAEAEAAIEANDARIDALNDERDAIEEMIRLSREWAQVVEDIDKLISDLMTGGASPLNPADAFKFAQQQYQQALAAFQATPTAANAAQVQQTASAMLQAFQVMRPAGRPSPEYEALVNETVAQLRAIQAFAAGQVTPEEQSLKRLESIDAEIKALNDSNEMIREAADAQIEAIEAARDGQIKAIEAARDLQITAIQTARDLQVAAIHAAADATVDGINREVARVMGEIAKEQARLIGLQIEQQEKILREITGGKDTQTYMLLLNKTTAGALANLRDMVYASLTGADPPAPNNAPPLARGGIVMKPTYALIGEAGPEVVRPLAQDQARGGTTTLAIENVSIHVGQGQNPRAAGREAADAFERRLIELIRAKPHVRHALRMFLRDGL